ncbi:MAG: hypothetical protein IPM82_22970 [Saprospiraceae bacterium]|nr:hypothetical protein [Saprospiraceae bacterium]
MSQEALRRPTLVRYEKAKPKVCGLFGFCHISVAKYAEALALLEEAYQLFLLSSDQTEPGSHPRIFWHHPTSLGD